MRARRKNEQFGLALGSQRILDYACARGASRELLIERMQLDDYVLDDPDARLPTRCYYNLIAAAADTLHDPWFGIHYLETTTPEDIGALGFAAASSRTLGEAFRRVARYLSYLTESERVTLTERDDDTHIVWQFFGPSHPAHALVSEMYAFDFTVLAARLSATTIHPKSISFRHAPLQPHVQYRETFGCAPQFETATNECVLDTRVLATPLPQANAALAAFFDRLLAAYEDSAETTEIRIRVRREITASLCDGGVTLASLARRLNMSPRTLQRELAHEDVSLREIVDDVRKTLAFDQLTRNAPLIDIAYLLGFSDIRSFFRAFKRWSGMTPLAWRAERARRM